MIKQTKRKNDKDDRDSRWRLVVVVVVNDEREYNAMLGRIVWRETKLAWGCCAAFVNVSPSSLLDLYPIVRSTRSLVACLLVLLLLLRSCKRRTNSCIGVAFSQIVASEIFYKTCAPCAPWRNGRNGCNACLPTCSMTSWAVPVRHSTRYHKIRRYPRRKSTQKRWRPPFLQ